MQTATAHAVVVPAHLHKSHDEASDQVPRKLYIDVKSVATELLPSEQANPLGFAFVLISPAIMSAGYSDDQRELNASSDAIARDLKLDTLKLVGDASCNNLVCKQGFDYWGHKS